MSPFAWRCSRLVLLFTIFWTLGQSGASESQLSAVSTAPDPQEILGLIADKVTTKVESLISQLGSRIDRLDSRLTSVDSRLTNVDSRLTIVDSRLRDIETRLTALDVKQDTVDVSLDNFSSRIESAEAKLDSGLVPLTSRVNSTDTVLDQLVSKVNTIDDKLDAGLIPLTSQVNFTVVRLDQMNFTADRLGSRVEELASQVNGTSAGQSDRLDGVCSRLDDLSSRLDDLANRTDTLLSPLRDCSELPPGARSGVHQLRPHPLQLPVSAYCDLETDGGRWTVIQRRKDIQPRQDFNLNWISYREGFGDLHGEFWWGLRNMRKLTEERQFELRVNLADFEGGRRHARYSRFRVGSEVDGYRLTVSDYSGTAGDSLSAYSGNKFSTKDRDQDGRSIGSCAQMYKGGWWFDDCYNAFLNGPYLYGERAKREGIHWQRWRGYQYSLKEAEMKIRPV